MKSHYYFEYCFCTNSSLYYIYYTFGLQKLETLTMLLKAQLHTGTIKSDFSVLTVLFFGGQKHLKFLILGAVSLVHAGTCLV